MLQSLLRMALHSHRQQGSTKDPIPHILMPSATWRFMLWPSLVVLVAGGPHKESVPLDDKLIFRFQVEAPYYYTHLAHPLTEAANLTPSTHVLQSSS